MVTVVKSEWHQVEKRYALEITTDLLEEIYPEEDEDGIDGMLLSIANGNIDVEDIVSDAIDNNIDLDWEWLDEDDWWTDRKGGYEVTYEVQDE